MTQRYDYAIVGAGIVGLSHALAAHRRGYSVCVVDRDERPKGATIRNFGMVWPIGMPADDRRRLALRSAEIWLELSADADFFAERRGSLHLARREDELAVLGEFLADHAEGLDCRMLSGDEIAGAFPGVRHEGLLGGLRCTNEVAVDPREAADAIARWLDARGVAFRWRAMAIRAGDGILELSSGERIAAERIIVCSGDDTQTLFPEAYVDQPLTLTKLQMLRLAAPRWRLPAHVAGGLTLRHYASFAACPTLPALQERIASENPIYDEFGIHVMATQRPDGTLVIGDSHVYDSGIFCFDSAEIERIILDYLGEMLEIEALPIVDRWHGIYPKRTDDRAVLRVDPAPGVTLVNCVGGAGMTLSPALGEQTIAAAELATA